MALPIRIFSKKIIWSTLPQVVVWVWKGIDLDESSFNIDVFPVPSSPQMLQTILSPLPTPVLDEATSLPPSMVGAGLVVGGGVSLPSHLL